MEKETIESLKRKRAELDKQIKALEQKQIITSGSVTFDRGKKSVRVLVRKRNTEILRTGYKDENGSVIVGQIEELIKDLKEVLKQARSADQEVTP